MKTATGDLGMSGIRCGLVLWPRRKEHVDMLCICILPPSKEPERPTQFATRPGSKALLRHFQQR
jgi:hypothetical protein